MCNLQKNKKANFLEKPWPWNISQNKLDGENAESDKKNELMSKDQTQETTKKDIKEKWANNFFMYKKASYFCKLKKQVQNLISHCGSIDIGLEYNPSNRRITVTILECNDLPNQDRGVAPIIQVMIIFSASEFIYFFLGQNRDVSKQKKVQDESTTRG